MGVKNLLQLYSQSAGKCPAYDVRLDLQVSRYCPLAVECWRLTEGTVLGLSFLCGHYRYDESKNYGKPTGDRISRCPIEDQMITEALQMTE